MRIYHNINSMTATNSLNANESGLTTSLKRLSTGLRINSAADDAAGLAISEKMRAQTAGLDQAVSNSQDGISLIQTAEGALNETQSILQRMRELGVQGANDTLTANDRQAIQEEIDQLSEEIDRISDTTTFNAKNLLDGSSSAITSTDNSNTKVYANGSVTNEGNYKISVDLKEAGNGQIQKTNVFNVAAGVETNEVSGTQLGYASTTQTVAASTAADDTTLHFDVDGTSYDVTITGASDQDTDGGALRDAINSEAGLNEKIKASYSGGDLTIERIDKPGENFTVWQEAGGAGSAAVGTIGTTSGASTDVDPATQNITNVTVADANDLLTGSYTVATNDDTGVNNATVSAKQEYSQSEATLFSSADVDDATAGAETQNQSALLEVTSIGKDAGGNDVVTFSYTAHSMDQDLSTNTSTGNVVLQAGAANDGATIGDVDYDITLSAVDNFTVGDKVVLNSTGLQAATDDSVTLARTPEGGSSATAMSIIANDGELDDGNAHNITFYQLDSDTDSETYGETKTANISFTFDATDGLTTSSSSRPAAQFTVGDVVTGEGGEVASGDTKLKDLAQFNNSSGVSLLDDPQTITLVQGDGQKATVTLYADDTLDQVASKFNTAMATTLGQASYADTSADSDMFAQFVDSAETTTDTPLSEAGSLVFSSAVAGEAGEINFIGDETIVNALGLSEVQASTENRFQVDVTDAHTGAAVASDVELTGNTLVGVVDENVDVEFDKMANADVSWNATTKTWDTTGEAGSYDTTVHIAANSASFQIGANEGETMSLDMGNMSAGALGVDNILVTDQGSASRSITVIDTAIETVSPQRSKRGAYQNRLDHTINNLTTASTNLTSAESRIRDVDYATEMTDFSKNQILYQAANSMLTQANQLPQQVLSLLR